MKVGQVCPMQNLYSQDSHSVYQEQNQDNQEIILFKISKTAFNNEFTLKLLPIQPQNNT